MVYYPSMPLIMKTDCGQQQDHLCSTALQMLDGIGSLGSHEGGALSDRNQNSYLPNSVFLSPNSSRSMQQPPQIFANTPPQPSNNAQVVGSAVSSLPPSSTIPTSVKFESLPSTTSGLFLSPSSVNTSNAYSVANSKDMSSVSVSSAEKSYKAGFKCEECGMTFGSKSAHTSHVKSHLKKADQMRMSTIGVESASGPSAATSETSLSSDQLINGVKRNNEAEVKPVTIPKLLLIKPINGEDNYKCNVCEKTFAVPARLIRHFRTHTGERPYECEFCHKLFSVKENLQVHRRIHTKERPYKCDVCGRAFEHSGKLHRHMRIHTGERPHKCSVCEKTFIQSGQLVIHMRTHTGEKPYKCPVEGCGKGFTCSKQLKVHSRTHTGEKPYHCDICFRDFGYNHVLKLHRVQHYGAKCYKCTICEKTFKSKKEMEAHIKRHANELPEDEETAPPLVRNGTQGRVLSSSSSSSTSSGIECNSASNSSPPSPIAGNISKSNFSENMDSMPALEPPINCSSSTSFNRDVFPPNQDEASNSLPGGEKQSYMLLPSSTQSMSMPQLPRQSFAVTTTMGDLQPRTYFTNSLMMGDMMPTDLSASTSVRNDPNTNINANTDLCNQKLPIMQQPPPPQQQQQHQYQEFEKDYMSPNTLEYNQPFNGIERKIDNFKNELPNKATIMAPNPFAINNNAMSCSGTSATVGNASAQVDDVHQAAMQMMQLHRSATNVNNNIESHHSNVMSVSESNTVIGVGSVPASLMETMACKPLTKDLVNESFAPPQNLTSGTEVRMTNVPPSLDTVKAGSNSESLNDIMDLYKTGKSDTAFSRPGVNPVPKFESSLINNEMIVKQVEAAIAPLAGARTETCPSVEDRSSSPESENSLMLADRDVMTLPLRKRKHYMNEINTTTTPAIDNTSSNTSPRGGNVCSSPNKSWNNQVKSDATGANSQSALRLNSVIQYAKAS